MILQKLLQPEWVVLLQPPYSPDLVPFYCHLLRYVRNSLNGEAFSLSVDVKNHLFEFFCRQRPDLCLM